MDSEVLARVEEQRLTLETNIAKLRKSLRHWQTLEIDYEGLKEEFFGLPESSTAEECLQAAKTFRPELIDEKELNTIVLGRKPSQLVDLLTKRTDYVSRNIETVRNQLSTAQKQWNALVLAEDPEHREEAALPLKDIIEELDDDGNVVSTTLKAPGGETGDLVEVLRKAGVPDLPKVEVQPRVDKDSGDDDDSSSNDIQPTNPWDTEEEAKLRQEMLQYGLGEVGQIVAELDLEDDLNDDFSDDYTDDESEDERGAAKNPVISDDYRRKMEALESKLGIKSFRNIGPQPEPEQDDSEKRLSAAEAARQAAIARDEAMKTDDNLKRTRSGTKKVAFADELDIVHHIEQPEHVVERPKIPTVPAPPSKIFADVLVERPATNQASAPNPNDFDEDLHRREIATDYQKLRNRKIHAQGGYVHGGEQDNYGDDVVLGTMDEGNPKRVSRFKAARIKS